MLSIDNHVPLSFIFQSFAFFEIDFDVRMNFDDLIIKTVFIKVLHNYGRFSKRVTMWSKLEKEIIKNRYIWRHLINLGS